MKAVAVILIVVGILMTTITGFNIVTREKVIDAGPLEISKTEKTPIYWSPVTGALLAGTGLVLLLVSKRKAGSNG